MDDDTEAPRPLDDLLDLGLYAPLGAVMTLADELPRAADIARQRLGGRLRTARAVGQFTVAMGRRRFEEMRSVTDDPARDRAPTAGPASSRSSVGTEPGGATAARPHETSSPPGRTAESPSHHAETSEVPSVVSLGIPGYDSLAASQVVQRLAGLEPGELEEVRRYEDAHRRRRTVLARVDQLMSDAP